MQHRYAAVAIVGLAVLVGATGAPVVVSQEATGGNGDPVTISVAGTGEASAEPDRALVFVAATAAGPSPSVAAERLAANVSRLRGALADSNRTAGVVTTGYQLSERDDNGSRVYLASQSFEVTVSDPAAVGDVVDLAVESGATEVDGVSFTLSPDRRREVRATAIDRAVGDARDQADAAAASTDLAVDGIRSVDVGDGVVIPLRQEAADAGTVIDPGPVSVTVTVRITYNASTG